MHMNYYHITSNRDKYIPENNLDILQYVRTASKGGGRSKLFAVRHKQ